MDITAESSITTLDARIWHFYLILPSLTLAPFRSSECRTPFSKTPCQLSRVEEKQVSGLVPRYLLPLSSRSINLWRGWPRRACPHQGARHQTGRVQVGDTLERVPTSGGRDGSSTSSAVILFCFTAYTLILRASPSLQTGGGACEHPIAPFARPGVCTRASY